MTLERSIAHSLHTPYSFYSRMVVCIYIYTMVVEGCRSRTYSAIPAPFLGVFTRPPTKQQGHGSYVRTFLEAMMKSPYRGSYFRYLSRS